MIRGRNLIVGLVAIVITFTFAAPVYADGFLPDFLNPSKMVEDAVAGLFNMLASELARQAVVFLADTVVQITEVSKIPSIHILLNWSKLAAGTLGTIFFIKRLMEALRDEITGENTPNIAEIIGSYVVSVSLVFATPYIILNYIIPLNNQIVKSVAGLGINVNVFEDANDILNPEKASLFLVFLFLVWGIIFISFAVVGAIRYVDLAIVLLIGPVISTTYVNRSQVYLTYWTEVVAVVFTQSIHIVLAYFALQWVANGDLMGICFSLAAAIVAMRGPQVLRQFLYQSGTTGMAQGLGRFAAYRFMLRGGR